MKFLKKSRGKMISRDKNSTDVLKITFAMGTWKKNLSAVVSQKGKSRFEVHILKKLQTE